MHVLSFVLFTKQGSAVSRGALTRHLASFGVFHREIAIAMDVHLSPSSPGTADQRFEELWKFLRKTAISRVPVLTIPTRARDSDAAPASGEASLLATAAV